MIYKPLGERVLLERKLMSKIGSLYVMKNSQEMRANLGKVIEVGDSCTKLLPGDIVTFGQYAPVLIDPREFKFYGIADVVNMPVSEDVEYLELNECDALGMFEDEQKEVV